MNIHEYLEEYRALTLDLMDEVQKDGELNYLIKERDDILKLINDLECDKEQVKVIGNSLCLLELENELQNIYKKEKVKVKKRMENIKNARKVNMNYNNIGNRVMLFNKTV